MSTIYEHFSKEELEVKLEACQSRCALADKLFLEAIHFKNTGKGMQFLESAIKNYDDFVRENCYKF